MTTFTSDAQQLFDRYLHTVRWSVRGVANPDEIERDVREHVSSALESQEEPVSSQTLREVLSRLGDPWQWVAPEDLPLWRRIGMRFSLGPEDWRLAYACFALTLLGMLLMSVGIGIVFLFGAFLLGRATYALVMDRDGSLGARRWLIYPPIAFFAGLFSLVLLVGPVPPLAAWGVGEHGFVRTIAVPPHMNLDLFNTAAVLLSFGAWWLVLSAIVVFFTRQLRALFVPFGNGLRRVHALWITALGTIALGAGFAILWQ